MGRSPCGLRAPPPSSCRERGSKLLRRPLIKEKEKETLNQRRRRRKEKETLNQRRRRRKEKENRCDTDREFGIEVDSWFHRRRSRFLLH